MIDAVIAGAGPNRLMLAHGAVASAMVDVADQLTVAAGRLVGDVAATAILVRPPVMWRRRRRRLTPTSTSWPNCVGFSRGGSASEPRPDTVG